METSSYPLFVLWYPLKPLTWSTITLMVLFSPSLPAVGLQGLYQDWTMEAVWKKISVSNTSLYVHTCTYCALMVGLLKEIVCRFNFFFWCCDLAGRCDLVPSHFQNWWQHHPGRGLPGDWDAGGKLHRSLQVHQVQSKAMKQVLISGHSHQFTFQQHKTLCYNGKAWEQGWYQGLGKNCLGGVQGISWKWQTIIIVCFSVSGKKAAVVFTQLWQHPLPALPDPHCKDWSHSHTT